MTSSDIDTDRETDYAVQALVHRLRNRDGADDEPFAREYVLALKMRGWRPTPARPSPAWDRQHGSPVPPDADSEGATSYRQQRAELDARLAAHGDEPGTAA